MVLSLGCWVHATDSFKNNSNKNSSNKNSYKKSCTGTTSMESYTNDPEAEMHLDISGWQRCCDLRGCQMTVF